MHRLIERYPGTQSLFLNMGQGGVYAVPTAVQTVLGSCVAVTFYSPKDQTGAMFHALLPRKKDYKKTANIGEYKYVDSAIQRIVSSMLHMGVAQKNIQCKVFGGANAFFKDGIRMGERNVEVAYEILAEYPLRVVASHVGGRFGRKLLFLTHTGEVYMKVLKNQTDSTVVECAPRQ